LQHWPYVSASGRVNHWLRCRRTSGFNILFSTEDWLYIRRALVCDQHERQENDASCRSTPNAGRKSYCSNPSPHYTNNSTKIWGRMIFRFGRRRNSGTLRSLRERPHGTSRLADCHGHGQVRPRARRRTLPLERVRRRRRARARDDRRLGRGGILIFTTFGRPDSVARAAPQNTNRDHDDDISVDRDSTSSSVGDEWK